MEFTETTLADMLQEMADERPLDEHSFTLRAFANALRGTDTHHVLTLKQKRPGKWKSPAELEEQWNREASWLWTLGHWEHDGMKTEAAIAKIAELAGVSRATVFAGVREAEKRLERAAQLMTGDELPLHLRNPRPSKS